MLNCGVKSILRYNWASSRQMIMRQEDTDVITLNMPRRQWTECGSNAVTFGNMITKRGSSIRSKIDNRNFVSYKDRWYIAGFDTRHNQSKKKIVNNKHVIGSKYYWNKYCLAPVLEVIVRYDRFCLEGTPPMKEEKCNFARRCILSDPQPFKPISLHSRNKYVQKWNI